MVAIVAVIAIDVIGTETAKEIVTVMTETVTDVIVTATEIGTATAIAMEEAGREEAEQGGTDRICIC